MEPISDTYDIALLNDGYPSISSNPDLTEELLNQKRVDYLKTMQEVTNEINKRSTILETEQKYLRGEI